MALFDAFRRKNTTSRTVGRGQVSHQVLFQRFDRLFREHFPHPGFQIARNLPPSVLFSGTARDSAPIDFLFCDRNGAPLLAVVLVTNDTWVEPAVLATKATCEKLGIGYMRFFLELPNEPEYVVNRIRQALP